MSLVAFLGDSRGKRWDDGLKCYEQIISDHELGPDTVNLHQGGSASGRERFYTVTPYGGPAFDLETQGLLEQVGGLVSYHSRGEVDTVVINSTGNDQLIIAEMYPVDSEAEQATIDAQQWVKDKRAEYFSANPNADQVQFAYEFGWNGYSKHKLAEAIRTLKHHLSCEVIVIGPLGWEGSPLAELKGCGNAQTTRVIYTHNMQHLCQQEGARFLDVSDIQGPWKANEGNTAIHIGQEGHDEIARRLLNRDWA